MSVFTPARINQSYKVRNSDYIHTENKPDDGTTKPAEPVSPAQPGTK
ncbi:MAG TPA: hypothetical protein VLF40_05945 [Candidatus Saccharimonadales bacterium]|nr:hypothetical protein [Candidatus Saccharimonadales bacterium]